MVVGARKAGFLLVCFLYTKDSLEKRNKKRLVAVVLLVGPTS